MRIAILSGVHSSLLALEAVLAHIAWVGVVRRTFAVMSSATRPLEFARQLREARGYG